MTCKNCERLEKDCKKVVDEWRVIVKKLQKERDDFMKMAYGFEERLRLAELCKRPSIEIDEENKRVWFIVPEEYKKYSVMVKSHM